MNLLFLQSHPSFFARDLGKELRLRGHGVGHIALNPGEWFLWRGMGSVSYRGSLGGWEGWLDRHVQRHAITHLVYFADRHPYHRSAHRVALRHGITPVSYEFGYLRPDWIVMERGGQSVFSHFPDNLDVIRARAADMTQPDLVPQFSHPHWQEAVAEVAYHLGNVLAKLMFPRYDDDRTRHPIQEYLSYIPRNRRARRNASLAREIVAAHIQSDAPFFLVALQMEGDYQIRANSRFAGLGDFLNEVVKSFATKSPSGTRLLIKLHPMDNGLTDWRGVTEGLAQQHGVTDRVAFLDGGDLAALLSAAAGCVVVNSTVGLHALQAGCPVKCLGIATYDIIGLTDQMPLDDFWSSPFCPDPADVSALVRLMAAAIHVQGDFFSAQGRSAAIAEAVRLLEGGLAQARGAEEELPPRLAKARVQGISVDPW